jgi:hypothetical protein
VSGWLLSELGLNLKQRHLPDWGLPFALERQAYQDSASSLLEVQAVGAILRPNPKQQGASALVVLLSSSELMQATDLLVVWLAWLLAPSLPTFLSIFIVGTGV